MEDWQVMSPTDSQGSFALIPFDQNENTGVRNDALSHRLKNRERQRRYRARKRLAADNNKDASFLFGSTVDHVQLESGGGSPCHHEDRVPRLRNWKRDARMAHKLKIVDGAPRGGLGSGHASNLENGLVSSSVGMIAKPLNGQLPQSNRGRRDWKAEARKKRN